MSFTNEEIKKLIINYFKNSKEIPLNSELYSAFFRNYPTEKNI